MVKVMIWNEEYNIDNDIKHNEFINEIEDELDKIKEYERRGYFENEEMILLVSENKFNFRDTLTGEKFYIEYTLKGNYDRCEYSQEEMKSILLCINTAEEYGFYV